jgi:hypothetical protein
MVVLLTRRSTCAPAFCKVLARLLVAYLKPTQANEPQALNQMLLTALWHCKNASTTQWQRVTKVLKQAET